MGTAAGLFCISCLLASMSQNIITKMPAFAFPPALCQFATGAKESLTLRGDLIPADTTDDSRDRHVLAVLFSFVVA